MKTMVQVVLEQEVFELGRALYQRTDPAERYQIALRREALLIELKSLSAEK